MTGARAAASASDEQRRSSGCEDLQRHLVCAAVSHYASDKQARARPTKCKEANVITVGNEPRVHEISGDRLAHVIAHEDRRGGRVNAMRQPIRQMS
jgi:hypothetical protein